MYHVAKKEKITELENDVLLDISNVENYTNKKVTNIKMYLSEFINQLQNPLVTDAKGSAGGFIGGWVQDVRKNSNVLTRSMITLDIDDGMDTTKVWDHVENYSNFSYVMYSTHNSKLDKPRYRLIIPLKSPIKPDKYKEVALFLADLMKLSVDSNSFTISQLQNYPTCEDPENYEFYYRDAKLFNAEDVPESYKRNNNQKSNNKKLSSNKTSPQIDDDEVIKIASNAKNGDKFKALLNGDISAYGSHSEADQALCNLIAFYTQDFEQIDRIFTNSELYREKWDRDDYKTETINKAINGLSATYQKSNNQLHVSNIVIPEPYVIGKNGMLYEKKIKKVEGMDTEIMVPVSRKTPFITKVFHNVEHLQVFYEIEWKESYGTVKEIVPASTLSVRRELLELSNKGFSVNENNAKNIIQFLDSYQSYNNIDNYHATERIGKIKGKLIHPILVDNVEIIALDHGEKQLLKAFDVKGSADSWKKEIFDRIKDSPKAVFIVLASFASAIINDLNIDPFLVDLSGTTSQGKTTTLEIASTVWGDKNLVNEWNTTKVAIERKAAFLNSFPLLMDDTRKADERILKDIIYQYSGGRSKGRGSVKGSQMEYTWQNILISTGEVSLNEYAREQGGAAARIIPLNGQPLKRDLNNIIELEHAMLANYGAIGMEFIKVWEKHKELLINEYHKFRSYYVKKSQDNEVLSRIASYYASIHFTGSILKEKLNLDIDLESISNLFDEIARENKAIDKPMEFLERILIDLDSDRQSIFYEHEPQQKIKALYKQENKQLFLLPQYTSEFLGVEERQTRKEWLRRGFTIPRNRKQKGNETTVDYNLMSHRGQKKNAIALNMDFVSELGFDFQKESK